MLRQEHRAGEKLFVDYAGDTIPVHDPATGEVRAAAVFVAVLGASSYTYAEATDAGPRRLDRRPHARLRVFRRHAGVAGPGQLEVGVTTRLPLRAGYQSHLSRNGRALWRGGAAGASVANHGIRLTFHTAPHPACAKVKVGCLAPSTALAF